MQSKRPKPTISERIETVIAGAVFIAIGTVIATSVVKAQNSSTLKSTTCAPNAAPEAMCTLPLRQGPESKICFGDHHARCFELKSGHLIQSINSAGVTDLSLDPKQQQSVTSSIEAYTKWLDAELSKAPKRLSLCHDVVSTESKSQRKEFCLSRLSQKESRAKTKDLLLTLENPTSLKSK